jgi:hypothetical protein
MAKNSTTAPKAPAKATKAPAAQSTRDSDHAAAATEDDKTKKGDAVTTEAGRNTAARRQVADTTGANEAGATGADGAPGKNLGNAGEKVIPGEGEVIQHKPTLSEALGGQADGLSGIGEGSVAERAPRIMGAVVQATKNNREVKQGDDVILHTRSLLNGKLENPGAMLKANQDGTIAVRIPLQSGGYRDFSPVYNGPQNGEDWFSIPEESGALDDVRKSE